MKKLLISKKIMLAALILLSSLTITKVCAQDTLRLDLSKALEIALR